SLHGDHLTFNRRADVAYGYQRVLEERVISYVAELVRDVDVVVLSGGVALNCTANARVAALCRDNGVGLVVPPPASDPGVALGGAGAGSPDPASIHPIGGADLGRAYEPDEIVARLREAGLVVHRSGAERLAGELSDRSAACGWFEGGAEAGPRALGRRCIV